MEGRKCYVLMVSKVFPKKHTRSGEPTNFIDNIAIGNKKHTIRLNYELWKKRAQEVNSGRAYLSVRTWSDKPYKSKQVIQFEYTSMDVQKIELTPLGFFIDDYDSELMIKELANNDGLSKQDFIDWFNPFPEEPCAVIQFGDFKYKNSKTSN